MQYNFYISTIFVCCICG